MDVIKARKLVLFSSIASLIFDQDQSAYDAAMSEGWPPLPQHAQRHLPHDQDWLTGATPCGNDNAARLSVLHAHG